MAALLPFFVLPFGGIVEKYTKKEQKKHEPRGSYCVHLETTSVSNLLEEGIKNGSVAMGFCHRSHAVIGEHGHMNLAW